MAKKTGRPMKLCRGPGLWQEVRLIEGPGGGVAGLCFGPVKPDLDAELYAQQERQIERDYRFKTGRGAVR